MRFAFCGQDLRRCGGGGFERKRKTVVSYFDWLGLFDDGLAFSVVRGDEHMRAVKGGELVLRRGTCAGRHCVSVSGS